MKDITTCGEEGQQSMLRCLSKKNELRRKSINVNYSLKCTFNLHACVYVVDCHPIGQGGFECKKKEHFEDYLGYCCNYVC